MNSETDERSRLSPADGWALGVWLLAVAARIAGAWSARCITDPDSSVVALMARHMAALKEFPVFFYGQAYMGSLEPMASALMVRLLGSTGFAVNLGPVLFAAAALFFLWRWARDAAGPRGGLAALLAGAFGPAVYFQFQTAPRGGYMVALVVDALALWASARMAARLRAGERVGAGAFFALGLLAGVGAWSNMIVASALLAAALLLAHGMRWKLWNHAGAGVAGLAGFVAGLGPWWSFNVRHGFASLQMSQFGGRAPPLESLLNSWSRFLMIQDAGLALPKLVLPALALAVLGLAAAGAWTALRGMRTSAPRENYARFAAILFCAIFAAVFVASGFNQTRTSRYWVPVVPGLAVLAAIACAAPGGRGRRAAAWTVLGALTLAQGGLCISAMRALNGQAEARRAAFRELGAALEQTGADALLAPIQMYPLNFALDERFAVSNGRQKFYEPILRRAELSAAPAYSSDFNGIETFLRQQGAEWDSAPAAGRHILWNPRWPAVSLREIPADAIAGLGDVAGADWKDALSDRNLDTAWSPGGTEAVLEWTFAEPRNVHSVQLVFSHGMTDEAFDFPRRIRLEARVAGEWREVLANEPVVPLETSGPRVYVPSGLARLEYRVDAQAADAVRVGLLDTRHREGLADWRLAEAVLFAAEAGTPPAMDAVAVDALGTWLRAQAPASAIYAPRWASNQLLRRGWVAEDRLAGLSDRVFPAESGTSRNGRVPADRLCVFVVEARFAEATRATLERCGARFREAGEGPWTIFAVEAGGWGRGDPGLSPAVRWSGDGLLADGGER